MKNAHLGGLEVSRIGLGAMTMAGTYTCEGGLDNAESIRTIHRALDLGVTHIDTAEIYGPFLSEEIVGAAIKGRRDQVKIATKFGLVSHAGGGPGRRRQQRREHEGRRRGITEAARHRPHRPVLPAPGRPDTPIEETAAAVADLIAEGKVLHFGLSEASPETIRRAHAVQPVRRCRPSTRCGPATSKPRSCRCCANSASGSCRTPRSATACSPGRSARRRLRRRRLAQDQPALHRRELPTQPRHRR